MIPSGESQEQAIQNEMNRMVAKANDSVSSIKGGTARTMDQFSEIKKKNEEQIKQDLIEIKKQEVLLENEQKNLLDQIASNQEAERKRIGTLDAEKKLAVQRLESKTIQKLKHEVERQLQVLRSSGDTTINLPRIEWPDDFDSYGKFIFDLMPLKSKPPLYPTLLTNRLQGVDYPQRGFMNITDKSGNILRVKFLSGQGSNPKTGYQYFILEKDDGTFIRIEPRENEINENELNEEENKSML